MQTKKGQPKAFVFLDFSIKYAWIRACNLNDYNFSMFCGYWRISMSWLRFSFYAVMQGINLFLFCLNLISFKNILSKKNSSDFQDCVKMFSIAWFFRKLVSLQHQRCSFPEETWHSQIQAFQDISSFNQNIKQPSRDRRDFIAIIFNQRCSLLNVLVNQPHLIIALPWKTWLVLSLSSLNHICFSVAFLENSRISLEN